MYVAQSRALYAFARLVDVLSWKFFYGFIWYNYHYSSGGRAAEGWSGRCDGEQALAFGECFDLVLLVGTEPVVLDKYGRYGVSGGLAAGLLEKFI